jgi:predicted nucleic acid-binding protein
MRGLEPEDCFISVVTASELLHGVHRASDPRIRSGREAFVEALLQSLRVLPIDLPTARTHARLWAELAAIGSMIGPHDSWLAAACIAHGHTLVTGNLREFSRVPGLRVELWAEEES